MKNTQNAIARQRKVLLIDDHAAVRRGFAMIIEREKDLKVCGEAAGPADALRLAREHKPDLAMVDLGLKEGSGLDLIRRLKELDPSMVVLVVSMHDEEFFAERAMRAGAKGYVMKEESPERLIEAVRRVLSGKVYLSQPASELMLEKMVGNDRSKKDPIHSLSDRELVIFQAIGEGLSSNEIAERLHLSVKTVETYRARIKERLGLQSGAELLRCALRWTLERRAR